MEIDSATLAKIALRMEQEHNIWLASVRADGRPHLVPIWFVWSEGKVWICTGSGSQKHVNVQQNPHVSVALEDGSDPVVIEGTATIHDDTTTRDVLAPVFQAKYDWDFRDDSEYGGVLIAITPARVLMGD
jgi:PPOX class probable F420-dependent enzyme